VPDRCSQIFFISGQFLKSFRHGSEQNIVTVLLVAVNQGIEFLRDSKYNMKVADIQQVVLSCVNPSFLGECLALGAVTVAAGVADNSIVAEKVKICRTCSRLRKMYLVVKTTASAV